MLAEEFSAQCTTSNPEIRRCVVLWEEFTVLSSVKPGGLGDILKGFVKLCCPTSSQRAVKE
jgi:hypothetical protein